MRERFGTFESGANVGAIGTGTGTALVLEANMAAMSFNAIQQQQQQVMAACSTGMLQQVHEDVPVAH